MEKKTREEIEQELHHLMIDLEVEEFLLEDCAEGEIEEIESNIVRYQEAIETLKRQL